MTGDMPTNREMTMNALYVRFLCAVLLLRPPSWRQRRATEWSR
jgi:hypothetical protein